MKDSTSLSRFLVSILLGICLSIFTVSCSSNSEEDGHNIPLTATFGKGTPGPNEGPYAVTLTNTSTDALTVTVTITWSVTDHTRDTQSVLPPYEIPAEESWTINDLATEDRIIVAAEGFEPLELTTPPGE